MIPQPVTAKEALPKVPAMAEAVIVSGVRQPVPASRKQSVLFLLSDGRLLLWNLFLLLSTPVWLILKLRKYWKKRYNYEFNMARWLMNEPSQAPLDRTHLVFVGATYGEVKLAEPVIDALKEEHPDLFVTVATRDRHTIDEWRERRPEDRIVLLPFDFIYPVAKFLRREQPDYMVFLEMYSFPNLVAGAKRTGSKLALINGRAKDFSGPARYERGHYRWILGRFDVLAFQTGLYRERVAQLRTAATPIVTGNLKLGQDLPKANAKLNGKVSGWLKGAMDLPILAAGSTNTENEDNFVIDAFEAVRNQIPCRLLLAPRNLSRVPKILKEIGARGLGASSRSQGEPPAEVMLLDTMGELRNAYAYAQAAYVGGSLDGMGHNVIEPALLGLPVSYGPIRGHFEELQLACEDAGVGFRVRTSQQLAEHWLQALSDSAFREEIRRRAPLLLQGESAPLSQTLKALNEMFE